MLRKRDLFLVSPQRRVTAGRNASQTETHRMMPTFLEKKTSKEKRTGEESPSPTHQLRFVNARKPLVSPVSFL